MTTTTLPLAGTETLARRVYADTWAHGGTTVNVSRPDEPTPVDGYVVALPYAERVIPLSSFTLTDVREYITDQGAQALQPGVYVGSWVNEGQVYLDLSRVIADRQDAERIGRQDKQLAIYDLALQSSVTL